MNVSAILTADWHLRWTKPSCWTGDHEHWLNSQREAVDFINKLQQEEQCPVLHAGDLFHKWNPPYQLLSDLMDVFPKEFITCYGNHDLPQHNLDLQHKTSLYLMEKAGFLESKGIHWNQTPSENNLLTISGKKVGIWHVMTFTTFSPNPKSTDPKAHELLKKYPEVDLFVTGDNHNPFVERLGDRLLVNPGNLTRQTADQIEYRPRVYLWNAEDNSIEAVYLPFNPTDVTSEHLEVKKEREDRINAFITKLNTDWEGSVSFEENIIRFLKENTIPESIKEVILNSF